MVYIFFYEILPWRYYRICPSVQHALNLVSWYAGDCNYRCEVLPYKPVACKFADFKTVISGIYGPEFCDLLRQDIIEFEFQYDVSLQIIDLYE